MVSRLKDATIDIATTQIDKVRDVVSPHLVRNCERLPIVLQGPVRELALGRPVRELTLDGIRTVGIGFLERVEAMLHVPGLDDEPLDSTGASGNESDDDEEACSTSCTSLSAIQRFSRFSRVPRLLGMHRLRTFAVQLSRSATLKVTVLCVQDTAAAFMRRLRVHNGRQLLDRALVREGDQQESSRSGTSAMATRVAKSSCKTLLGEWLFAYIFGAAVARQQSQQSIALEPDGEELVLDMLDLNNEECESDDDDDAGGKLAKERCAQVAAASSRDSSSASSSASSPPHASAPAPIPESEPAPFEEFRLIVKNSFIEIDEPPSFEMRRANSWESMRGQHRSISSEPFTLLARRWEPRAAPGASPGSSSSQPPQSYGHSSSEPFVGAGSSASDAMETEQAGPFALDGSRTQSLPRSYPQSSSSSGAANVSAAVSTFGVPESPVAADVDDGRTTVMLRNVPSKYSRAELLALLDAGDFEGRYEFVYVPVDFTRNIGLCYALVCMATPMDAELLLRYFNGFTAWGAPEHGDCPCETSWSEPRQGLQEHIERYRNSPVMHKSVPDEYKPILFHEGKRIDFPPPTKAIRPPRIRHIKSSQPSDSQSSSSHPLT